MPPITLEGLSVSDERVDEGTGVGVTVSKPVFVAPPYVPEMTTLVDAATVLVLTEKVVLVAPAGTVTLEGTLATVVLLLESVTCAPPDGAGPLNATVPVDEFPPVTLAGFSDIEASEVGAGAEAEASAKSQIAGLGSFSGSTTNVEADII